MMPPAMNDRVSTFFLYQPWGTSLYRSDDPVQRWLRVVPNGSDRRVLGTRKLSGSLNSQSGRVPYAVVTTMDMSSYLSAVSYGSTCHIETGIVRFANLNGLGMVYESPMSFMTQAMLRNYESRLDTLVRIAESKVGCVFRDEGLDKSLVCEMRSIEKLWAQLMNVGYIEPAGVADTLSISGDIRAELPRILDDRRQLKARLIYSNFCDMPYKIEEYQREHLLRSG